MHQSLKNLVGYGQNDTSNEAVPLKLEASKVATNVNAENRIENDQLDFAYFNSQTLVIGCPVVGANTSRRRHVNNAESMVAALNEVHGDKFLLFNFTTTLGKACAKDAKLESVFNGQIVNFQWHLEGINMHMPPLMDMFEICYSIKSWCAIDSLNVAVLCCQDGKTRSAIVLVCYLLFSGAFDDPFESYAEFYRVRLKLPNITEQYIRKRHPPSLQNYFRNFHDLVEYKKRPNEHALCLKTIMIRSLPVANCPLVQIWNSEKLIFETSKSKAANAPVVEWVEEEGFLAIVWEHGIRIDSDFCIVCSFDVPAASKNILPSILGTTKGYNALDSKLFHYIGSVWFHTTGFVSLTKNKVDIEPQYVEHFDPDEFSLDLVLVPTSIDSSDDSPLRIPINLQDDQIVIQGTKSISDRHAIQPNKLMMQNFLRMGYSNLVCALALQRSCNCPNEALDLLHSNGMEFLDNIVAPKRTIDAIEPELLDQPTTEIDINSTKVNTFAASDCKVPQETTQKLCWKCKHDDFLRRNQLISCTECTNVYHTFCAGQRRIPFKTTTKNDKKNHSAYVEKHFFNWTCSVCEPMALPPEAAKGDSPTISSPSFTDTTIAVSHGDLVNSTDSSPKLHSADSTDSIESPRKVKYKKLQELLLQQGMSMDDMIEKVERNEMNFASISQVRSENHDEIEPKNLEKCAEKTNTPPSNSNIAANTVEHSNDDTLSKEMPEKEIEHADLGSQVELVLEPYQKMLKLGVPLPAVKQKMVKDGIDRKLIDKMQETKVLVNDGDNEVNGSAEVLKDGTALEDDTRFETYFKMLRYGCPAPAVKEKMKKDGVRPEILDLDRKNCYEKQFEQLDVLCSVKKHTSPLLKDLEEYKIYFKMLSMGISKDAVGQKMRKDGVDVRILDLDPNVPFTGLDENDQIAKRVVKPKRRRKKLHWEPIPEDRLSHADNIWHGIDHDMDIDMVEFDSLFVDSNVSPRSPRCTTRSSNETTFSTPPTPKSGLIENKRATNIAISIARIKLSHLEIANAIDQLNVGPLTSQQLQALCDFVPTAEERKKISTYDGPNEGLTEAEHFFRATLSVERYSSKLQCLVFISTFDTRLKDLYSSISNIKNACYDVKMGSKLKILLSTVLKVGNKLNTNGDDSTTIKGFTVDSLLKLGQTKAYNKKTTVLHYLIQILHQNSPEVLRVRDELANVPFAAKESMSEILKEYEKLNVDLQHLHDEHSKRTESTPNALSAKISTTKQKIELLDRDIKQIQHSASDLLAYFGEDPKTPSEVFFSTLCSFLDAFDTAKAEVERQWSNSKTPTKTRTASFHQEAHDASITRHRSHSTTSKLKSPKSHKSKVYKTHKF